MRPTVLTVILATLSATALSGQTLEARLTAKLDALSAKSSLHAKHLPTGQEVAI